MNKFVQQIMLGVFALSVIGTAVAADPKPEEEVRYRQSVFNVIARSFNVLGAIVKGERPYDQALALKSANIVESLSTLPFGSFGPGTDVGTHKTDPKVWKDNAKFKELAEKFQFEAAKLPAAAKDPETLKIQVGAVGKTCKACHDDYRVKDKK